MKLSSNASAIAGGLTQCTVKKDTADAEHATQTVSPSSSLGVLQ